MASALCVFPFELSTASVSPTFGTLLTLTKTRSPDSHSRRLSPTILDTMPAAQTLGPFYRFSASQSNKRARLDYYERDALHQVVR